MPNRVAGRTLDRIQQHDPASRSFGISRFVADPVDRSRSRLWVPSRTVLDQGQQGHCGAFAATGEAMASPVRVRVPGDPDAWAHAFYYEIKDRGLDPWGREEGTSTLAVMTLGKLRGLWGSYAWAFSLDDLLRFLVVGPFLLGVPWMTGMMRPDSDGRIQSTGVEEGGHLVCVTGWLPSYRRKGPHYRIRQSWGKEHGLNGSVYLPEEGMYSVLIAGRGEASAPVDRELLAA